MFLQAHQQQQQLNSQVMKFLGQLAGLNDDEMQTLISVKKGSDSWLQHEFNILKEALGKEKLSVAELADYYTSGHNINRSVYDVTNDLFRGKDDLYCRLFNNDTNFQNICEKINKVITGKEVKSIFDIHSLCGAPVHRDSDEYVSWFSQTIR